MTIVEKREELNGIGRPLGAVDPKRFEAFAQEAEMLYVKPMLGDTLYLDIVQNKDKYKELLNGGSWTDAEGNVNYFSGLKAAISYFIYAQNLMSGDIQTTRFGNVLKDNEYSQHISSKERSDAYNGALEIGNTYMRDVLRYCNAKNYITSNKRQRTTGAIRIRKIG